MVAASQQTSLLPALVASASFGLTMIIFGGLSATTMQLAAPEAMRGRVMAVYTVTIVGAMPLGQLALGTLGSVFGLSTVLLVAGLPGHRGRGLRAAARASPAPAGPDAAPRAAKV